MKWTTKQIEVLRKYPDYTDAQMVGMLGLSEAAIRNKRKREGLKSPSVVPEKAKPTTLAEDRAKHADNHWKSSCEKLQGKYDKLLAEQTVVDRLVGQIKEIAPRSYSPAPSVYRTTRRAGGGTAQSAVLMFSDTHIGKSVKPSQTLSFGSYDFATFMARLKYLEESTISIVENHVTTDVPELVIAMLGDMLDGALSHSNEVGQLDPVFNQFYAGAHAIAQFFRNLAAHFPKIRVYDVVGNHTRFQGQHKMPTKNRYSNFDNFLYALVRELVRDIKHIEWEIDPQPYELFDVAGFAFFAAHGDTLRGGDKNLGIPNHAVGRLISTATQMMTKYGKKNPNYYLVGHLHRDIVLPHATGSFMVNGGFPGVDEFGLSSMFTPADPSQKLFFMHPIYGKTATYDISLKFAKVEKTAPYSIPKAFEMH